MDFSRGTLSKKMETAAGSSLQDDSKKNYPKGIQHGEIAVLGPGHLKCKAVYCGSLPRFDKRKDDEKTPEEAWDFY